jgi:hypothetical protein
MIAAAAHANPIAKAPAAGVRCPTMPSAMSSATIRPPTVTTSMAAARSAYRPTAPDRTSSRRPASSSTRVCRMTTRTPMIAMISMPVAIRQKISAPSDGEGRGP